MASNPSSGPFLPRIAARIHAATWPLRAATLGVRAIVLDETSRSTPRVFLVRHTYVSGWYLPGGGVDPGETAEEATLRELVEEGGITCRGRPTLFGLYANGRRDHVACFVVRDFDHMPRQPDREIAESGFFPLTDPPVGTSRATRDRLAEAFDGRPQARRW